MVLEEAPQYALCLNMIVKDESHIIKDTLTKLFQKIKFDYWIISDTGSTDETKEIITDFFKEVGIPGELYEDEWVDFSHNRNKALEYAFGKSKYLLIFDADDEICGDFVLPELVKDYYHFQFGSHTRYTRTQIINNCKRWKYVGVLHECIVSNNDDRINVASMEVIKGHYYTVSGRSGNRNLDSNKYLKDAIILEKAYYNAVDAKDDIYHRYGFYCANSYYDCDKYEHAISWYKKTLENCGWSQEKYVSCLKLYTCYEKMNNIESGFFYLVKSAEYDRERAECYYELIKYYSGSGSHDVAYGYYGVLRNFYNNSYLKDGLNNKLFLDESVSEFYLPYYVIIVSEKMRDYDTGIQMYRIIFTKKCKCFDEWFVGNLLYNLQFFTEHVKDEDKTAFYSLFQEYVDFLVANNYPLFDETMKIYEKYGIKKKEASIATDEECLTSKKILIYIGFMDYLWNDTYVSNNAIGGAEKAVAYLARNLPKEYEIIISGDVADEVVGNVKYVNRFKLQALLDVEKFHTIIVSRYVSFFLLFPRFNCHQLYLSAHDSTGFLNNLNDVPVHTIIEENNKYIKGVICLTTWHKLNTIQTHACLKDKVFIINNGILVAGATSNKKLSHNKIKNKFVWTSCSYRGLDVMLKLWDEILEVMPDATLDISSYDAFPCNKKDEEIQMIINRHSDSVKHHGKLNTLQLHDLISKAEYWLYTNTFCETSCITAFEMLMHEVVCLYYPLAGLVDTIGEYGIQVNSGNEIQIIMNLSEAKKVEMRINGKKYAMSCSWENRAKEWASVLGLNLTYPIYIINLKRRKDRRENVEQQLKLSGIDSYNFVEAVDGKALNASSELFSLFERNDFNFNKGVIGCALSHIHLWNNLINDKENDFYIILEDDITFCDNFKKYLGDVCKLFVEQKLEHLALGEYNTSKVFPTDNFKIDVYYKDLYKEGHVTFAYIISKNAAKKYINYINSCSIKCAIDNPQAVGYILNYSALNVKLVHCQIFNEYGTDIQSNNKDNFFEFTTSNDKQLKILKVSFCDWWNSEYCGGCFDLNNNFFTNLLREYGNNYEIKIINPSENPDILFYSIFGFSHKNYKAGRKIFFSGEPYPQRDDADFNVTFDENSFNNTRVPLWLCYFDKSILEECKKRKNNQNVIPNREKFCSFVASGSGLTNNRKEFVEKLSKYKQVDCGGSYLNNIGYNIPIGSNCSGKIEHNNNYKFATAFESAMYKGYVTEKICDVFKSNCVPIYWGHPDVVKDYNPKTFINANDFENFDELVDYIIKVDNDEELYKSFFKEQIIHPQWIDILLNDTNKLFFKNLADKIIGKTQNIFNNLHELSSKNKEKYYAANKIDEFLSTYIFKGYKNGYFMDIGANDGISINNTLHFEEYHNWRGTNIEPLDKAYNKLVKNRPKCNNIQIVVNNIEGLCDFIHNDGYTEMISGLVETYGIDHKQRLINELNQYGGNSIIKKTKTKTVKTICNENNISHINYLSIDVEGAEMAVLESIDYHHTFIDVISFEENYENITQAIINFLEKKGYIYIGKFGDIIMIHEKSNFIKNLNYDDISSFSCYGSIYNIKLKNILEQINYNKTNDNFRNYIFEYGIDSNKKDVTDIIINILESTMQNFVIPIGDDIRAQLFGDNCRGHVKKIFIYNKNNPEQTIILTENESKIIYFDEKYNYKFVMGFYDNGLSERGTTTMMFSYADYAEKYFKCKSIIFYNKHHHANNNEVINRFSNRFDVYRVENFDEIDRIISDKNIKYFYNTCAGKRNCTELVKKCKNLIHAVFDIEPFGDKYSAISDYIVKKSKYPDIDAIPYMIDLPIHNDNMIHELNLPDNAFIIGRIGGYEQFDIKEAHTGIINFLNNANNTYFVFVNTAKFYEHPQIIYLDKIVDPYFKVKYINTCNCMIHARSDGETFGLAIAEFSSFNKPIVTCRSDKDNCHLDILGEKAIVFDSETSLINILKDIKNIVNSRDDWNAYKEYTPDKVMKKFMNVFMPEINNSSDNITFDNINYIDMKSKAPHFHNTKELVIVSAFLDINREKWSTAYKRTTRDYILSFSNYFNYNTKMLVFIDDKYIEELEEMYNNSLHNNTIFIPINNDWMTKHIYAWQLLDNSKHIMQSDEYRNLVKDRIACGNPENIYADYNGINHSKIDFICYAINNNLINRDDFICWSDFGYFNSILHNNPSEYPINHLDITKFNPNKLSFCLRNKLDNKDKDTIHTLVNAPERFTGSFFAGSDTLMIKLQELYHISLKELYSNNISDDDQHIYLRCFLKEPNIFNLYLDSCQWPKGLCYFEKLPDRFELVKTLLANIKNGKFVEIGCDTGTFSKYILTVNKTSTLYSVDPYISYDNYFDSINYVTGDNLHNETNMKLTQEFGDRFKLIREFSNKACNLIPDNLNFVYIDGNHQYEYVYEDLCLWWEKLAPNGIIVGDDAVDTDETKRDKNGNIFIEWCPGSYGKYGVIHAFNRFIIEKKCYGQVIGNQFVLFK